MDCIGSWTPWGECSNTCGPGTHNRTYYVLSAEQDAGRRCESRHEEVEAAGCNMDLTCQVPCSGTWSKWSKCTASEVDSLGRLCGPGQGGY